MTEITLEECVKQLVEAGWKEENARDECVYMMLESITDLDEVE